MRLPARPFQSTLISRVKPDFVYLLDNAAWPAFMVDATAQVCRANSAAKKLLGLNHADDLPALQAIWSSSNLQSAEQFLDGWERAPKPTVTLTFQPSGGSPLKVTLAVCALFMEGRKYFLLQSLPASGNPPALEVKTGNGDASPGQKQKLECALQLARTVALDFNNALTSILGHTSLILSKMEPGHAWRPSLLEVEKSAARAAEIANDLATFSRGEKEGRGRAAGNLNLVLQTTVQSFRQSCGGEEIRWEVALERKLFSARFDEAKMQQAFVKILENAVQAMDQPGRILVQTRNHELVEKAQDRGVQLPPGAYVSVEISDTGRGIPADKMPRIFEPFFTTKGGSHRGLGLAWVYGIVTNHGGGVAVSSQPGVGTSVRVYLPAEMKVVWEDATQLIDLRGDQTVLVVDDEELLLTTVEAILSSYGYRVLTANSGQKALEILAANPNVDVVVTDLVMPAMSGGELIERMQQISPAVRVLRTSGYVRPERADEEAAFLKKPFTSRELLLKIKEVMAN